MAADTPVGATSKIRIRLGSIEVEYEGAHEYLNDDLPKLLGTIVELREKVGDLEGTDGGGGEGDKVTSKKVQAGTVAAIAAKLNATKGPDLIIAAAAKLTFVDGQTSFARKALLEAMQSAKNYYKQSYGSNFSQYLKRLVGDNKLTEPSTDHFALTAPEVKRLEGALA